MDSIKGMFSSPIDSGTNDEIKELIKSVLTTFTGHYVKQYAIGLAKKAIKDAQKPPKIDWKLEKRPPGETKFMEGWVLKRAGPIKKSMQKRYFRVRSDYMIDYYLTEEEAKKGDKGKKKGTIALCGYWVNEDANSGMLQRLLALAKKMGLDTDAIPKPAEFPPHTMELYHSRRKSYYIQLEDKQEFSNWVQQMRTCCWMVRGFKNKDKVHIRAFEKAIRETRWEIGRWGYWGGQGTEEEILSDMIADELDYEIMGRIYSKIQGPWQVRSMAQKQVLKIIDKLVLAGVTPAWGAMAKAVEELRPKIEPKLKESITPLAELQGQIADKIKEGCMSVITPAMDEHVIPHLAKILAVIQSPVADAFTDSYKLFESEVAGKFDPKGDEESNKPGFRTIDYVPWSWTMWDITRKTDEMYEPLWALNIIFPEIWPWSLIWTAHDNLKQKMDNAVYTYEKRFLKALKDGTDPRSAADQARDSVMVDYKHDGDLQRVIYFRYLLKSIVMPPLSKVVNPLVAAILTPIDSIIPGPMKDLVSVREMFDQVLNGIIDDTIDHALRSSS